MAACGLDRTLRGGPSRSLRDSSAVFFAAYSAGARAGDKGRLKGPPGWPRGPKEPRGFEMIRVVCMGRRSDLQTLSSIKLFILFILLKQGRLILYDMSLYT